MRKAYVVKGTTGDYEDRQEWLVKAFHNEETAQEFLGLCNDEATRLEEFMKEKGVSAWNLKDEVELGNVKKHKHDPYYETVGRTSYSIEWVELLT